MSALSCLLLASAAAVPGTLPTLEVTGYSRLPIPVDAVRLSGQLIGVGPDAETADEMANTRVSQLIAALQGESPQQVEITLFGGGRPAREKGASVFRAYRNLHLTIRDLKKLDLLLTAFCRALDGPPDNAEVVSTRLDEWKQKAVLAASADAKQQATKMLGTLGGKLGPARYVQDARYQNPTYERRMLRRDREARWSLEEGAREIVLTVQLRVDFSILER